MKEKEIVKYRDMLIKIKSILNSIYAHLPYGLSRDEKAFIEIVDDLAEDLERK